MIGFKAYRSTPTTLDLNGPFLSYTTQPVGLTTESSTINLIGIATALPVGTGSISYQWYETGYGPIATSSTITGTATTTLTLNELNFNDSGREFYLEASYEASAYGTSDPITAGTARSTGNAPNAPLNSDTVEIQVGATIVILQQPTSSTIAVDNDATFSVLASIGSSTGAGVPAPCIAVIDQTNTTVTEDINDDWTAFRNKWPTRPFNIFRVPLRGGAGPANVILPSVAPTDYIVTDVNRDENRVGHISNWFEAANLDSYAAGTTVTLWIDNSGSMTPASVAGSYNKFVTDCAAAGILIDYQTGTAPGIDEKRYIYPFIDNLTGGSVPVDPNLVYQWKVNGENPTNTTTRTVSGGATRILTINDTVAGIHTVACSISYPGAVNSPLLSDVVNYDVAGADVDRSILHLEEFDVNATLYSTKVVNLEDEALEIIPSDSLEPTGNWNRIYSINAPEEDVTVKITMKAAGGAESENGTAGGEGGVSVWTMTLTQQQEYVVNLGARMWPSGGVPISATAGQTGGTGIGGNGGGGSFFYQGGELLVAVGGGGGGGQGSVGGAGDGGGIGAEPDIRSFGYFPFNSNTGDMPTANTTARQGGQVARCTIGNYWANQGIAPCVSIGSTTFFTGQNGQKSTSIFTTPVIRGYKAGLNYQFNGGNGQFNGDGGGGGGSQGGFGGNDGSTGGTGGRGYATIPIDSATIGGHSGVVGTIKIEKV
tara:strand:+ start:1515 stop:3650 length:2136 start_codon:yes stop_codon:yes gene_type:complete